MFDFVILNGAYLLTIAAFVSLAMAVRKWTPMVGFYIPKPDPDGSNPAGAIFLIAALFCFIMSIIIGVAAPALVYRWVAGPRLFASPGQVIFDIGWLGNVAQVIAALCSVTVLVRCWPLAVAIGGAILAAVQLGWI